ncbi:hypothetical protein BDY21DRAFT_358170 [Lineolata rhizophorae]|uniref:Uncharacterized protein n=1 Tax=Lineolata rhizophorae TaxID=578093 RepID=A0A6A6NLX3_9PEZI|nr:hypothetical protein BDY21DRAFT_358170 [Lineolata rhizophorae]
MAPGNGRMALPAPRPIRHHHQASAQRLSRIYPVARNGGRYGESNGWGRLVFSFAGKVWEFCRNGAFKGFYAGGGKGYEVRPSLPPSASAPEQAAAGQTIMPVQSRSSVWEDVTDEAWEQQPGEANDGEERSSTPVPGQDVEDHFEARAERQRQQETPPRPTKRLHTDNGASWVMVSRDTERESRQSSPRLSARKTPALGSMSNHRTHLPRPVTSRASSRRSIIPVPRRQSAVNGMGSPVVHQAAKPPSYATPRSPVLSPGGKGTPMSAEAQRYAAKLKKEEREADESIRRLNQQLKAMIKEGREALGTKIEIEGPLDDDMDEGFLDGCFAPRATQRW